MKKRNLVFLLFASGIFLMQCMPDRMPPAPVENERPKFVQFSAEDSGAFAVPLRDPISMTFDEPMTLSTFNGNFILASMHGMINGTFSQQDTTVMFTPTEDMRPATYYEATVLGGVRDQNGNSLTLDEDWKATIWFFTAGQYSESGFPRVFIADRSFDKVYLVGNFNEFINESSEVIQPRGMVFTPDGQYLLVVSRQLEGKLAVIDPAGFTKTEEIAVGVGPEDIAISQDKIFVVNTSEKTISVLSYPGYNLLTTISFTDGFGPRDIAYSPGNNYIYVSSNALNTPGLIKVIDAATYQETEVLEGVLSGRRTEKLQVSTDGQLLVVQQERTDFLRLIDTNTNQFADSITIPVPQNKDMDIYDNQLYICSSGGIVYKYDLNNRSLVDSTAFSSGCDGVSVAPFGEVLYVSTAVDSTVHALDIETLHVIRSTKVASTISKLIVSPENY